uniref:Uncharacterized protein n=1 Tax=Panagrolaimus superbus TaxID=310955 RepID=A0A914YLS9_9BILA
MTYQRHLRDFHPNGNIYGPFLPQNWNMQQFVAPVQPEVLPDPEPIQDDMDFDIELLQPFEGEELIPDEAALQPIEPDDAFNVLCAPFLDYCFKSWLQFLNHPDATIKSADLFCLKLMETMKTTIHLTQPYLPQQEAFRIDSMLKTKLLPFSTEHRRRKYLEDRSLYSKPEEYVTSIQLDVVGTPGGNAIRDRRNMVAVIPIEKTLKAVLSIETLANALVMPSDFTNAPSLCHPFAGKRAQNLINKIGDDFLLIELYMDEFTTSCPIGNSSAVYKMAAWYIRLLNFPLDMISQLDHILLACLAHAVDVMDDLQEIIRLILLPQLKKLETDGITIRYQGYERNFKVILYRLSADNLGFHQMTGLTRCFSGNNPCWLCTETAETLRTVWILDPQKMRTRQRYDHLISNGTPQQRLAYGIKANCCLNELQYFHCMEDFSVDYMHDLHEGHFLRFIPRIVRDAIAAGVTLDTINGAITGFGLVGPDGNNPIRPIYLPAQIPDNGDTLSGYTAKNSGDLVRLLPLMFKFAGIRLQTPSWQVFMKLQRIIDILYAPDINQPTIDMFDALVKSYLKDYIAIGGKMTVKPHKLLHYKAVMEEMGPLRHLATFRYEGKHHHFKQYAHVNRCFKNLQTTLADKNELMFAYTLMQMNSPDYLANRRRSRSLAKFKKNLAVVYGQNPTTREPCFGEIYNYDVNTDRLSLKLLSLEEFDASTHCYIYMLMMQVKAFVTVNGAKPTRSLLSFSFESAKVSDLCTFIAERTYCPPGSTFNVTVKPEPGSNVTYAVAPDLDLQDKTEMFVSVDPPSGDFSSFQIARVSPSRSRCSQSQPTTPRYSQATASLNTSASSWFDGSSQPTTSSQQSSQHCAPSATAIVSSASFNETQFMDQVNAILVGDVSSPGSSSTVPANDNAPSHTTLLHAVALSQRQTLDDAYAAMQPDEPVMLDKVDVHGFFRMPARKAALFVLKNPSAHSTEVLVAARYIAKRSVVELLVHAYPEYSCPANASQIVTDFLAAATGNDWFLQLKTTNGSSLIMNAFNKRKHRFRRSIGAPLTPIKKKKLTEEPASEDLDAAALALAQCSTEKEMMKVVANTALLRCTWIKSMEASDDVQIPEVFMKKFPCFVNNVSLLHEDYKCNMLHFRELPVTDFAAAYKKFIPAIYALAEGLKILPPTAPRPTDADEEAWVACKLLIRLVPKYVKRNSNCKPERLFAEGWDSSCINALHQARRDIKQTAPMIFVITTYPSQTRTYFVAADDLALKVKGSFLDALQSLMELHYVFDLAYAKELKPFFLLLERMSLLHVEKPYSTVMDLYFDLKTKGDSLDQQPDDASTPSESSSTEQQTAAAEQQDQPESPPQLQEEEEVINIELR